MLNIRLLLILIILLLPVISSAQDTAAALENIPVISAENAVNIGRLAEITLSHGSVLDIAFDRDGRTLLIANSDGIIQTWDFVTETSKIMMNYDPAVYATFSSDDTKLACLCGHISPIDSVQVFDIQTGERIFRIEDTGSISDLTFDSSQQQLIVAGGWTRTDTVVEVWDTQHGHITTTFPKRGWTSKADFNPSGNIIAVGYLKSIELWNMDTITQMFTLQQYYPLSDKGSVSLKIGDLTFNSTGTQIASMSPEGFIWLWDAKTGTELRFLSDQSIVRDATETLYSQYKSKISFNPNNDLVAAVNGETIRLWNIVDGTLLKTINEKASDVIFNVDGTILATANAEGQIILWRVLSAESDE